MALLGKAEYTVRRRSAVTWVDGDPVAGAVDEFTVIASVQPIRGRDLLMLPEGERTGGSFWLYSLTPLVSAEEDSGQADLVTVRGRTCKVMSREDWTVHTTGVPHYKHRLTMVGQDEPL